MHDGFDSAPGMTVFSISPGSPADLSGLEPGDRLTRIDGRPVEDLLDLQYYLSAEGTELEVHREGSSLKLQFNNSTGESPGWELEPLKLRTCRCRCTFCFVDQLPPGLRPALYVKDEDYRFSFLFGNYLTLVGLNRRDFDRILRLRLSPLYVSIHATNAAIRGRLLGLKSAPILPRLRKLIQDGIQIHGQIVLVPGENGGEVLADSLAELMPLYPGLASLSVVPVGLTEHREGLAPLRPLNEEEAHRALDTVQEFQRKMIASHGARWVFPSDELLLLTGEPFLSEEEYESYPQIENGVGLVRWTLQQADAALNSMPESLSHPRRILWVTGELAFPIMKSLAQDFCRRVRYLEVDVVAAQNRLMGSSVTVAGLLGGRDLWLALEEHLRGLATEGVSTVYLPPDCLNSDGLLLDDWIVEDIAARLGIHIEVFDGRWEAMILGEEGATS